MNEEEDLAGIFLSKPYICAEKYVCSQYVSFLTITVIVTYLLL